MAQMVAGQGPRPRPADLHLAAAQPRHPDPFRRLGQRFMYVWYYLKDEKF